MGFRKILAAVQKLVWGVLAVVACIFLQQTPLAVAQSFTTNDLNSILNQTPFFDSTQIGTTTCSSSSALSGNDNIQKAFNYFVGKGLTAAQAAGVVGNLIQESSVNPEEIQNGGTSQDPNAAGSGGWGIAQWTPGSKVIAIAQSLQITSPIYDLSTQLDIVWGEMNGTSPTGDQDMVKGLQQINDTAQAAEYFEQYFEEGGIAASGGGQLAQRQANAQQVLQQYGSGVVTSTSSNGCGSSISPDCQTASGVAKILCDAKQYDPVSYSETGAAGHQGGAAWHQSCPVIGPSCVLDCSGLVNIAVYDVYNVDLRENTYAEVSDTQFWKEIPITQVQPGDLIQPDPGHVEIIDHVQGNTIYTFGAHTANTDQADQVGPVTYAIASGYVYLHYIGPGSGS
jgi:cell wall-associated NlpC family hydrolase